MSNAQPYVYMHIYDIHFYAYIYGNLFIYHLLQVSFFRQFFRSVRKTDYLAMRHGFINVWIFLLQQLFIKNSLIVKDMFNNLTFCRFTWLQEVSLTFKSILKGLLKMTLRWLWESGTKISQLSHFSF